MLHERQQRPADKLYLPELVGAAMRKQVDLLRVIGTNCVIMYAATVAETFGNAKLKFRTIWLRSSTER